MGRARIVWESGGATRRGPSDDLLTAGLGSTGILDQEAPKGASPRVVSVHKNFRDLTDLSPTGGFVSKYFNTSDDWKIPGVEYTALLQLPNALHPFTVSVCVPDNFDCDNPTIIVAPSSGSRGLHGAIGDVGTWALKTGCALVLTDKGTGTGAHILDSDQVFDPELNAVTDRSVRSSFRLKQSWGLRRFRKKHPGRVALKHAHSAENVEADWPEMVLEAAKYGRKILSERHPQSNSSATCTKFHVIAAGVSNGGGAVLRAAERDTARILDGIVAVEPNVSPQHMHSAKINVGGEDLPNCGLRFLDYATQMMVYLPCTLLSKDLENFPFEGLSQVNAAAYHDWSEKLFGLGLLSGQSSSAREQDARNRLLAVGFGPNSEPLNHMMAAMQVWNSVSVTFANAYGRYRVEDALGGVTFAFASTDEMGFELIDTRLGMDEEILRFGALNGGLSPGGGAHSIYAGKSVQPSLDDALFFRQLVVGNSKRANRVQCGMSETLATAQSSGHPTLILHGRSDSLICPDHSSRAYFASASNSNTDTSNWRYYEVENGQHFEAFLMLPGFSDRFAPLWSVLDQALTMMQAHLRDQTVLPPSQVVRSKLPEALDENGLAVRTEDCLPYIASSPGQSEIKFASNTLAIPA